MCYAVNSHPDAGQTSRIFSRLALTINGLAGNFVTLLAAAPI